MSPEGAGQPLVDAVPGVDRRSFALPVLFNLDVDGEEWAVRRSVDGGTYYECISNPDLDRPRPRLRNQRLV